MTNETQTIDADALRARLAEMARRARDEMAPAGLRGRIEAALRARHGATARLVKYPTERDRALWVAGWKGGDASQMAHSATPDADALAALAVAVGLSADGHDPRAEVDALESLVARQADILTGVANALRGDPGPLASHGHHDLAERVASMVALLAVTQSSLEAASSGRRVTVVDEIERLQRERDALRAAAREYLDAREAYDAADTYEATNADDERRAWERRAAAQGALRALVGGAS